MANRSHSNFFYKILRGNGPIGARTLALILMIIGAAGFIASLILFGEQVLCQIGSTLVVFAGFSVIVMARRYSNVQEDEDEVVQPPRRPARYPEPARKRTGAPVVSSQAPAPAGWSAGPLTAGEQDNPKQINRRPELHENKSFHLTDRVSHAFREQGARVELEAVRDDKSILRVVSQSDHSYSVLIDEGLNDIQVSDIRALFAIRTNHGSDQAIYVSASAFAQPAVDWAKAKSIILVAGDMVQDLILI